MLLLVKIFSNLLAILPERLLAWLARALGWMIYRATPQRRQMALRNLHHCFPSKNEDWRRSILKEHCNRLVEMALFVITLPSLSEKRVRRIIEPIDPITLERMKGAKGEGPVLLLTPHFTLSEATTTLPLHFQEAYEHISVIFRPINNPKLNDWVTQARSRFGVELLSRRNGFSTALKRLEDNKAVALLFDQNAGGKGSFIHFMNRVVSATELPGLMAARKNASAYIIYAERTGFWRARFKMAPLEVGKNTIDLTLAANEWLAEYLASSDDHCADWLWMHDRWGTPKNPKRRFHLREKRNRLEEDALFRKGQPVHRTTTVWIFLPEGDQEYRDLKEMLKMIREARPDYALSLISEVPSETMAEHFGELPDRTLQISSNAEERRRALLSIAAEYPDVWINLRSSEESLKESALTNADQRFGIESVPKASKYLTDLAPDPNQNSWMPFFEKFGLGTRKKHRD